MQLTPEVLWRLFVSTGSVQAYLAYRRVAELGTVLLLLTISLN